MPDLKLGQGPTPILDSVKTQVDAITGDGPAPAKGHGQVDVVAGSDQSVTASGEVGLGKGFSAGGAFQWAKQKGYAWYGKLTGRF